MFIELSLDMFFPYSLHQIYSSLLYCGYLYYFFIIFQNNQCFFMLSSLYLIKTISFFSIHLFYFYFYHFFNFFLFLLLVGVHSFYFHFIGEDSNVNYNFPALLLILDEPGPGTRIAVFLLFWVLMFMMPLFYYLKVILVYEPAIKSK